jgi:hypothetical protein
MNRKLKIAMLSLLILFTVAAVAFCVLLIQNYRWQFDMEMTHGEMIRHVRYASIALALFAATGVLGAWRLLRLVRTRPARAVSPN